MYDYDSISELCLAAEEKGLKISELVLADQAEQLEAPAEELYARMERSLAVMEEAVKAGLDPNLRSTSGLTGGDAAKMWLYASGGGLAGALLNRAIARSLAVAEYNAAMGKIVAAPTAGSCGILPGTVASLLAEGLCTAAALAELRGGTPDMCAQAAAIAIKNQLGLVCDPVAGLVEIPCIKRNAAGTALAFAAADMALAGISSRIPADECIEAMREVGESIPCSLRETAGGGLAATPTGKRLREQVYGPEK